MQAPSKFPSPSEYLLGKNNQHHPSPATRIGRRCEIQAYSGHVIRSSRRHTTLSDIVNYMYLPTRVNPATNGKRHQNRPTEQKRQTTRDS
jgi:hypothetical protein